MKEDKELFLKVDSVEPVFKGGGICSREPYLDGVKVWINGDGHFFPCDRYTVCNPDAVRKDGRHQAMILAIKLYDMSYADKCELFEASTVKDIFLKFPYEAIVEKLDAWKKEKEKIRVKDEVKHKRLGGKAVVIGVQRDEYGHDHIYAITKKKEFITDAPASDYTKTGQHIDDLDAYLEV